MWLDNTGCDSDHVSLELLVVVGVQGHLLGVWATVGDGCFSCWLACHLVSVEPDPGLLAVSVHLNIPHSREILY